MAGVWSVDCACGSLLFCLVSAALLVVLLVVAESFRMHASRLWTWFRGETSVPWRVGGGEHGEFADSSVCGRSGTSLQVARPPNGTKLGCLCESPRASYVEAASCAAGPWAQARVNATRRPLRRYIARWGALAASQTTGAPFRCSLYVQSYGDLSLCRRKVLIVRKREVRRQVGEAVGSARCGGWWQRRCETCTTAGVSHGGVRGRKRVPGRPDNFLNSGLA